MNLFRLLKILRERKRLLKSESLSYSEILNNQVRSLAQLRQFAYSFSPFYQKFHESKFGSPLSQLPVLTKKILMQNFDQIVTDRSIKKSELIRFLQNMRVSDHYRNRYIVNTTGGTSGLKGIFLYDENEWASVIASYARANDWAGIHVNAFTKLKIAVVSSTVSWHQSSRVGQTLKTPFITTLRIDSTDPLHKIVRDLNSFQPAILVGYPSIISALAKEQVNNKLSVRPRVVFCAAEVLTDQIRESIRNAWSVNPFNVYGATEAAGIASECEMHNGLHLYEDLVIPEVVDEHYNSVPPGKFGDKLLVTVLFSRTIPLIRYEVSDSLMLSDEQCACGRPFRLVKAIQGREEEVLVMRGKTGDVKIQPNVFHNALEKVISDEWQVVQISDTAIEINVQGNVSPEQTRAVTEEINKELELIGAVRPSVTVHKVDDVAKTQIGKRVMIKALKNLKERVEI